MRRLGITFELTGDPTVLAAFNGPKINYGHAEMDGCLHIRPHPLLFETEIENYSILCKHDHEWDTLMLEQHADIPFDIFDQSSHKISFKIRSLALFHLLKSLVSLISSQDKSCSFSSASKLRSSGEVYLLEGQ